MPARRAPVRIALVLLLASLAACSTPLPGFPLPRPDAPGTPPCGPQAYPFMALQGMQAGAVTVLAQVGPDGRVASAEVEQSSRNATLDAAAREGARHCRFPAAAAGTQLRLQFHYELWGTGEFMPRGVVSVTYPPH